MPETYSEPFHWIELDQKASLRKRSGLESNALTCTGSRCHTLVLSKASFTERWWLWMPSPWVTHGACVFLLRYDKDVQLFKSKVVDSVKLCNSHLFDQPKIDDPYAIRWLKCILYAFCNVTKAFHMSCLCNFVIMKYIVVAMDAVAIV